MATIPYNGFMTTQSMFVVGSRIAEKRTEKGLTQAALAKIAGLRQATISGIEHEEYIPRRSTIKKIASALGCREQELTQ
jgi:transcriptional regulator with XRE-family HTH domain